MIIVITRFNRIIIVIIKITGFNHFVIIVITRFNQVVIIVIIEEDFHHTSIPPGTFV